MFSWVQLNNISKSVSTKISFPYQFKVIGNEKIADPVIYISTVTQFGVRKIGFLVDSGSDAVVLPLSPYRYWFRFTPDPNTRIVLGGIEGRGVEAYPSRITLQMRNEDITVRCYFVKSNAMPLLGRLDIWDKFNWLFDNKKERVVFERIK